MSAAVIVAAAGLFSAAATRVLIPILRRRNLLDRPNERSSHRIPTPRGGGIAVIAAILLAWLAVVAAGRVTPSVIPVAFAAGLLAALCWIDDLHGLSPLIRLSAQAAAVVIGLLALPASDNAAREWLGSAVYFAALASLWVWWINLYNFMDGIDGIAGSEAVAIAAGLMLFAAFGTGVDPSVALLAAAILGSAFGFLLWNWSPARIFLGDVGSAPLGYLTGYVLLGLATNGRWKIALILPLYFLCDATITLGWRLWRGERIWQAHRRHFYQRAVARGLGHAAVVRRVMLVNLVLIGCGWTAENGWGLASLAVALAVTAVLLTSLAYGR